MKYLLLSFFLFSGVMVAQEQTKRPLENVVITSEKNQTQVRTNENGELHVNVAPEDVLKFKTLGLVHYSDFGARGSIFLGAVFSTVDTGWFAGDGAFPGFRDF